MKFFSMFFLCVVTLISNVHAEDDDQLKLLRSITSGVTDVDEQRVCDFSGDLTNQLSFDNVSGAVDRSSVQAKSVKFYSSSVFITVKGGFTFHVADYYGPYGTSRIVTCLDGNMIGHQGISDNGILQIESTNVIWYKDYFVHFYPAGHVTSYANKQICEF